MHAQGFVLLKEEKFDSQAFLAALQEEWGIVPDAENAGGQKEDGHILTFSVDGVICSIGLMPAPVPDREAERNAAFNWMWAEARETAARHRAHLLVVVMGGEDALGRMRLYSKLVSTCLNTDNALGVYTSGTVFAADFYRDMAARLKEGENPLPVWVFIGLYVNDKGSNAYTIGLQQFGKDEMEILASRAEITDVFATLSHMANYVIDYDVTLRDGETIGFSAEQKLPVTRSKAVAGAAEYSLKIGF